MAAKHGNRVYVQVLLEPNRGELFLEDAKNADLKASAHMRKIIYEYLQKKYPELYFLAEEKDKQKWQEAVQARLEGRALRRRADLALKEIHVDNQSP